MSSPQSPPLPDATGLGGPRHLARLRRAARARGSVALGMAHGSARGGAPPAQATLLGASGAALALAGGLMAAGVAVTIVEPDADAATRLRDHLARSAGASVTVSQGGDLATCLAGVGLVIDTSGRPDPGGLLGLALRAAPPGALVAALVEGPIPLTEPARLVMVRMVAPSAGLVELMSPPGHDAAALARAASLAAGLGCVALGLPPGAEGPAARLLARFEGVAEALIFAGAAPWDLDAAAEGLGFARGPCALMDRLGVDSALPRRARLGAAGVALPDPGVIARMVAEGRLGRRASVGWFRYPGGGGQVTDPLIEDLVREEAWFARHPQRSFDADALSRHLLAALIDEAARLLADGAVARSGDIDLAAVLVLGFPPRLGGPVWLADRWGADAALRAVVALQGDLAGLAGWPGPAPALRRAAVAGLPLSQVC